MAARSAATRTTRKAAGRSGAKPGRSKARKSATKAARTSGGKATTKSARKGASKSASRKKVARKTASRKGARRGPGRPPGAPSKTRGSVASRRLIRRIAKRILSEAEGMTREEAAERTGAHVDDIKNLKAGNLPSLKLFLRVVREGGYDPEALIKHDRLKKLPRSVSTRGARAKLISDRVRKLARDHDPATLAAETGLSIYTIYQHRVADKRVGLHTILAFVDADVVSAREIFLG